MMSLFASLLLGSLAATDPAPVVSVLEIKGAIGPATTEYLTKGFTAASERGETAVVLRMDTPGGLDAATRDINQAILASPVPIIAYVHPPGGRAASAGTYILFACHLAAMAPATNLGSATPVAIGGAARGSPEPDADGADEAGETASGNGSAMERKVVNDAVAYLRGLAERRGRNADWAELAVREAANLTSTQALEQNVIELIAADLDDLLEQAHGVEVETAAGVVTLNTRDARVEVRKPDWRTALLSRITDPTIAYLLFIIGLYGLLLEGYSPGALVPGIVGGICLILALYAFQVLPINFAGVALIVLGVTLMVAEAFAPSFGALGIGGVVALVVGSVILIDEDLSGLTVPTTLIGGIAAVSGLAFLGITLFALRARQQPVVTGGDALVGAEAIAISDFDGKGRVHLLGEDWQAHSTSAIRNGQRVRVIDKQGLTLSVIPIDD